MKKNSKLFLGIILVFTMLFTFYGTGAIGDTAYACTPSLGETINCDDSDVGTINDTIFKFVNIIAGIVFGVAILMIVYAGFKYATSQGDAKQTEEAKMQIVSAGIGIGIALLAFVILSIFKTVMGSEVPGSA